MPQLDAGRLPLVPLLKYGSFEQLLDKQTGALLVLPRMGLHLAGPRLGRAVHYTRYSPTRSIYRGIAGATGLSVAF